MEPVRPNAYLRCESRRPSLGLALGLWKYGLALVIVASAAIDALWLVPDPDPSQDDAAVSRAAADWSVPDSLAYRCVDLAPTR